MNFRYAVVTLAMACMSADAFVPTRSLMAMPSKVLPTVESPKTSSTRFAAPLLRSQSASRYGYPTARFMSDAVAETPEPEKKNFMEKVSCF